MDNRPHPKCITLSPSTTLTSGCSQTANTVTYISFYSFYFWFLTVSCARFGRTQNGSNRFSKATGRIPTGSERRAKMPIRDSAPSSEFVTFQPAEMATLILSSRNSTFSARRIGTHSQLSRLLSKFLCKRAQAEISVYSLFSRLVQFAAAEFFYRRPTEPLASSTRVLNADHHSFSDQAGRRLPPAGLHWRMRS